MVMDKTTMSVQEFSAQMGISLPKAYALVKQPGFLTIKIGTRSLIKISCLFITTRKILDISLTVRIITKFQS